MKTESKVWQKLAKSDEKWRTKVENLVKIDLKHEKKLLKTLEIDRKFDRNT